MKHIVVLELTCTAEDKQKPLKLLHSPGSGGVIWDNAAFTHTVMVNRPLGWAESILEMVQKFFTHLHVSTHAAALVTKRQEILELLLVEVQTDERHLKREIAKHISKLHEVLDELDKCRNQLDPDVGAVTVGEISPTLDPEEHERDEMSDQPESV